MAAGAPAPALAADGKHHWAILIDRRKCIGCQACTVSCIPGEIKPKAEGKAYPARDALYPNAPGLGAEWFTAMLRSYPYGLEALVLWSANPVYGIPGLRR